MTNIKLTEHQSEALKRFPDEGWHRIDMGHYPDSWRYPYVTHPEATARHLEDKGYLESKLVGYTPGNIWSGHMEYRKIQ